ncbi:hypothetical protein [Desulfopila sp. IMCC35008]|uniref:hypothetical protein n=1 Tax=Desulfopila sp. IMCC35008 TaxID=2653858 RepID=UPI0013D75EB7|nr:hypothetical protein [Desulfopila sp. IMCC35008]
MVALCRYFRAVEIPFRLVARHGTDAILNTQWRDHVLFQRKDASLNVQLMKQVALSLRALGLSPVLCPTSEFLNCFVLGNHVAVTACGWNSALPEPALYQILSSKGSSGSIIHDLTGLSYPTVQPPGCWVPPCVLKPKYNIINNQMLYPIICKSPNELAMAMETIEIRDWFSQEWVEGQSLYLCAYLAKDGYFDCYWQENLLQQPGGKSIVLARSTANPGIDVSALMSGLHRKGYFGPFMIEIMRDSSGRLSFIEVNPRFWGPLNLSLKVCPGLLNRFAIDQGLKPLHLLADQKNTDGWYAWAFGALNSPCRRYPAVDAYTDKDIRILLRKHDVYAAHDTQPLAGIY